MSPGPRARSVRVSKTFDQASHDARSRHPRSPPGLTGGHMDAFLLSFGIIFVAELGDKSQLMAMTFAARYRAITILIAITAATALVHLVSVFLGAAVGVALPTDLL